MPNLFRPTIVLLLVVVGVCTAYDLWAVSQNFTSREGAVATWNGEALA